MGQSKRNRQQIINDKYAKLQMPLNASTDYHLKPAAIKRRITQVTGRAHFGRTRPLPVANYHQETTARRAEPFQEKGSDEEMHAKPVHCSAIENRSILCAKALIKSVQAT